MFYRDFTVIAFEHMKHASCCAHPLAVVLAGEVAARRISAVTTSLPNMARAALSGVLPRPLTNARRWAHAARVK